MASNFAGIAAASFSPLARLRFLRRARSIVPPRRQSKRRYPPFLRGALRSGELAIILSGAEVCGDHVAVGGELRTRAGQDDAAAFHHVGAVGEGEGAAGVLLDE